MGSTEAEGLPPLPAPGTALVEELDKKQLIILRDGRKLIGILRSFDQFANLVLEDAFERIIVGEMYGDIPLGLYVIRGENVVLLGQVDPTREVPANLTKVTASEIKQAQKAEKTEVMLKGTMLKRMDFLDDVG
ncbi:Sm-like protein [Cymbomonas tetramitiformis]|uniref:U6 snRNA-associated Sm-like protein LSm1 n=1 Tax=Cymbomonas tetramitiformis TaxID=36881 RepID=A0AAE0G983_9CHLO|nr:Sm-like protein [Cymbomonas tetramitiformis]